MPEDSGGRKFPNLQNVVRPSLALMIVGSYVLVVVRMAWVLLAATTPEQVEVITQVAASPVFASHTALTGVVLAFYLKSKTDPDV